MGGIFLLFLLFFLRLSDACLSSRGTLHHDDMEKYESCERDKEEIHSDFYLSQKPSSKHPKFGPDAVHLSLTMAARNGKTDPWMGK